MKRKVFALLLAVLMLTSALPLAALAADSEVASVITNPKATSQNAGSGETAGAPAGEAVPYTTYYTNTTAAGKELRKFLKARDTGFTIYYRVPVDAWNQTDVDDIVSAMWSTAIAHTGVGNEGDYLRNHVYSFNWENAHKDSASGSYVYASITMVASYYNSASQESTTDSKVSSLLSSLNPTGTNYKKLKKVYDWIRKNVSYDTTGSNASFTAYGALVNRSANHWGYASLLYRLALEMDIDCRMIWNADMDRAWNIATTGNLYYNMDSAGDAVGGTCSRFLVTDGNLSGCTRASAFTTSSFKSAYPMGRYNYNPDTAATIVTQPKSVTVESGQTAKVTVKATGDGLTYKWYYKDSGASKYSLTDSFTGNYYSVKMNSDRNGRKVLCKVTDQYGNTVSTKSATLSMGKFAKITTQPKSVTVPEGETAKVTLKATGDGLTYKWYFKDAGASSYTYTSSFKSNSYSVTMTDARDGRRVLCKVYDKYGNMVQSNSVTLNMATPLKITTQPKSVTVANGETAKVTLKAQGDGLTYKWYFKDPGDSDYTYTSTFTGNYYKVTMNADRNGRRVICKVYDKYGDMVQSNSVTLNMKVTLKITEQPKSVTVQAGKTAKVTVVASGEGLTYTWYYKNPGDTSFKKTTAFTGNTYSVPMNTERAGRQVYCVVKDKFGNSVKSDTATLLMQVNTGGSTVIG